MSKNNTKQEWALMSGIIFLTVLIFYSIFLSQPAKVFATIPFYNPTDSCGLVNINFASTGPNCPIFSTAPNGQCQNPAGNPKNPNINSQTLTVTLSSTNGQSHQVSYWDANSFCTNGYLSTGGGYCSCTDNAILGNQIVTVPANGSVPITMSRSPTIGSNCGSYQLDFTVLAVDGNTGCNSGNTSNAVGGSLTCETGTTCTAPLPTPTPPPSCTTTPTNCSACAAPANTCSNGNGTQTCTLSQPQTCSSVAITQSCTLNNCTNGNVCTNQTCQPPTYTVSGNIFTDGNKNGLIDNGEANFAAKPTITTNKGTITLNTNGSYTVSNILQGTVTLLYTSLPTTYYMTSPVNGPPPSYVVTVGNGCTTNGAKGAICTNGNIANVNFGISNLHPWWQSTCGDVRENPITDMLPAGASALVGTAACNNTPGTIFTGATNATFGQGQDSSTNQIVGGTSFPEVYNSQSNTLITSYNSLLSKAQAASVATISLASVCNLSNCTLPANLAHGIYTATGNVALNTFSFPANQNYIFLVNGNLTLQGALSVPTGSTALFSTTGNIVVTPTVGSAVNSTAAALAGWFIAGQSFIINSAGNCNDLRLNIGGSVVINAQGTGGTFQNNRDLCGNDANIPTVSFLQRLDMIINTPQFLRLQQNISQEVAP